MPSGRAVSNKAPVLLNWSGCESEASTESCISGEPSGRAVSNKAPVLLNWSGCESEASGRQM